MCPDRENPKGGPHGDAGAVVAITGPPETASWVARKSFGMIIIEIPGGVNHHYLEKSIFSKCHES